MKKKRSVDEQIDLIARVIDQAKQKTIGRINKQLHRMSPKDVQTLERLIGRR